MGVGLHLGFKDFDSDRKLYGTFNSREEGPVGGLGKAITPPVEGHGFSRG